MNDQAESLRALNRLSIDEMEEYPSKIVALTSGKGGTGKTFISLNLAYALAKENKKVLLLDLDFNMSNVELMLNINSEKTIFDFLEGRELLPELITKIEPNLDFIFGFSGVFNFSLPSRSQIDYLFNSIRRIQDQYDIVLIDTGAGMHSANCTIMQNSDLNLIVTTPEPTAIMDAYVMIKNLNNHFGVSSLQVLVNKSPSEGEGANGFEKLETAVHHFLDVEIDYLGLVNFDQLSFQSILDQNVFIKEYPNSKATRQIFSAAKGLIDFLQMANNNHHTIAIK